MRRSNMPTEKELSKHSQMKSSHPLLRLQSKAKLPTLQSVVNEWKAQTSRHSKHNRQQLLAIDSEIDNHQTVIKILVEKISFLQNKLVTLSHKHAQICSMLYKEIQKKTCFESTLRKENEEMNKVLRQVMEQANKLVGKLYNKEMARKSSQQKIMNNLVVQSNKQNVNRLNNYNHLNKLSTNNLLQERRRSRSRKMKLFSTRTKSKTILSNNEDSDRQQGNTASRGLKINEIQRNYYKSEHRNDMNSQGRTKNHKILTLLDNYSGRSPIKIIESQAR